MSAGFLALFGGAILLYGSRSGWFERSVVTAPMVFVALGVAVGTGGLGWVTPTVNSAAIEGLAELTLILVLFTDATRIDLSCLRREGTLPGRMLGIGMPGTVLLGGVAALLVLPSLTVWEAFLLAAILAPTDAALGQAVVGHPSVPQRIRQALNVESGLNDGIALPAVLVFAALASGGAESGEPEHWVRLVGLQLVLGPLVGVLLGLLGGRLLGAAAGEAQHVSPTFQRVSGLGLAVLAYAVAELVGGNGFIAAFVGGLTLGNTRRTLCECLHEFGEAEGQLLTLLVFFLFGCVLVPDALSHLEGRTLVYAALSLTVVRMVPVALSLLGAGLHPATVGFLAWFGPRGLASILFALLVMEEAGDALGETLLPLVVWTVVLSVFAHGMTSAPAARRYGAFAADRQEDMVEEGRPVMEVPLRGGMRPGTTP